MSDRIYRVAILGCRGRGTAAARAYHAHPRCEIVGLCDLIAERTGTLGDELGIQARYEDLDLMIRDTGPDVVVIPTGTEFHHDLCVRVLAHAVHIDVEKPICVDLTQADEVLARACEQDVRIAVHHQGRTGASLRAVASAVRDGRIGELRHMVASGKGYYGGYGLMNIGTHLINDMLELAGHCRRVTANALTDGHPIRPEDVVPSPSGMGTIAGEHITATLEFDNQVTATLLQHRFPVVDTAAYGIEVLGTEGRLFWKSSGAWIMPAPHCVPNAEGCAWEPLEVSYPDDYDPASTAAESDYGFADDFVLALEEDREHACSGPEGLHVLEVIMGIFESAAYGRPVTLPQEGRDHPLLRWRREAGLSDPDSMPRDYNAWLSEEDKRLGR